MYLAVVLAEKAWLSNAEGKGAEAKEATALLREVLAFARFSTGVSSRALSLRPVMDYSLPANCAGPPARSTPEMRTCAAWR
jgi:hypothetical protein